MIISCRRSKVSFGYLSSNVRVLTRCYSVFQDGDQIVLTYHYYNSKGSFLGINLLDFSSGWPVVY